MGCLKLLRSGLHFFAGFFFLIRLVSCGPPACSVWVNSPGPAAAKHLQTTTHPCFTAAVTLCSWNTVFSLGRVFQTCLSSCPSNSFVNYFVHRTLFWKCWLLSLVSLENIIWAFMFLVESKGFLLALLMKGSLVQSLLIHILTGLVHGSRDDILEHLRTSLRIALAVLRGEITWIARPEHVGSCFECTPLIFQPVKRLISNSSAIDLNPTPDS